MLMSLNSSN